MKNQEIARIFNELAEYLEMEGVAFKPYAYQKAALTLENLKDDVAAIYQQGGLKALKKIPGVGESMALKIEEYLKTGKIQYYEEFKQRLPIELNEIMAVEGLGPKKAKILYEHLGIRTLADLEAAAQAHQIAPLFGFGAKTEANILEAIEFVKRSKGRFLLGEILPLAEAVRDRLSRLPEVEQINIAGSVRRMKETIGDVDLLAISRAPDPVMDFFVSLPEVVRVWGQGHTKSSVRTKPGFDMDLRVIPAPSYGAALQYFTGSKEHNIALRKIAIDLGYKLSEYGLFKGSEIIAAVSEEAVYQALGLQWIPPELREDRGEIEAAAAGKLPKLIDYTDIRGDLHVHSNWNGGAHSIADIAAAARQLGYDYVGIADHTKFLRIERGLDEATLEKRNQEIDRLNQQLKDSGHDFTILKGCEANIMADGSIDITDESLAQQDFVIAGVHSQFKMTPEQMTERVITAMHNPHVDIIAHPTGRILKKRTEYEINLDQLIQAAQATGTVLEINAYPERLDLDDLNILKAKQAGVKLIINTDAHHIDQLRYMKYGIGQARRGWAEKPDIINAWPVAEMLKMLK
ncbi:MAG: DNA polymerase III [Desulfobacca sp. 4484_104]|nr:MAG: DNA polymerase III [Desulfobacca sp. 4484_104]RLA91098.1 MAG: DNA polymerase/3'-5' exonuclease PolX [Deltaproteobacteria bacterium]